METINSPNIERFEKPKILTAKNVIYWSETYKKLIIIDKDGKRKDLTIKSKAQRFVENKSYKYDSENKQFLCLPIQNYNHHTYRLKYNKSIKDMECSCQGFQSKLKKNEFPLICCHVLGLKLQFKIWHNNHEHPEYMEYVGESEW